MKTKKILLIPLALLLVVGLAAACCGRPSSGEFPTNDITIIAPFSAGGGADRIARVTSAYSEAGTDVRIRTVPMPGGGSAVGSKFVADAKPDGYTLLISPHLVLVGTPLLRNVGYTLDDFEPVCILTGLNMVLAVNPDAPWSNLSEFVAAAKERPGELSYGHPGTGGGVHMFIEAFLELADINVKPVPFDGTSEALAAIVGGHVDAAVGSAAAMLPNHGAGEIRIIATPSAEGIPGFDDIPTLKDEGYDFTLSELRVIVAPKGTPAEVIGTLEGIFKAILEDNGAQRMFRTLGEPARFGTSEELARTLTEHDALARSLLERIKAQAQ